MLNTQITAQNKAVHYGRPQDFWYSLENAKNRVKDGTIKAYLTGWNNDLGHYIEWMSLEGVWCPTPWYQEHEPEPWSGSDDSIQ